MARMMLAGGVLRIRDLIYDFGLSEVDEFLGRWFARAGDDPALGYTRGDLAEHVRSEFSTFRWVFEPMVEAAGFEIETVEFEASVYGAYTCVKR